MQQENRARLASVAKAGVLLTPLTLSIGTYLVQEIMRVSPEVSKVIESHVGTDIAHLIQWQGGDIMFPLFVGGILPGLVGISLLANKVKLSDESEKNLQEFERKALYLCLVSVLLANAGALYLEVNSFNPDAVEAYNRANVVSPESPGDVNDLISFVVPQGILTGYGVYLLGRKMRKSRRKQSRP